MFYVKKDKDEDQVHIMEHDQLSFSSITDQAAGMKEEQKQEEPFVAPSSSEGSDGSVNHWDFAVLSIHGWPVRKSFILFIFVKM